MKQLFNKCQTLITFELCYKFIYKSKREIEMLVIKEIEEGKMLAVDTFSSFTETFLKFASLSYFSRNSCFTEGI